MIDPFYLSKELKLAGITTHGNCDSSGVVWSEDNLTQIQSRPDVAAIIAAHIANTAIRKQKIIEANMRRKNAASIAKAIPTWATWTQAEWLAYFDLNLSDVDADQVTSFAAARIMIKRQNLVILNLVKMLLALRDETWPDLPDR